MTDTVHEEGRAVVELEASEARNAHIAASKRGFDRDCEAMCELHRAFPEREDYDSPENHPSGVGRFVGPSDQLSQIAMKAQTHGKERREKGHSAAQKKYYSVGSKMESQLIRQGEWVEDVE